MSTTLPSTSRLLPNYFSYREDDRRYNLSAIKFQGIHGTCNLHALLALMETKVRMQKTTITGKLAIKALSVEHVLDKIADKIKDVGKDYVRDEVSKELKKFVRDGVVFEEDYLCDGQNGKAGAYRAQRAKEFEDLSEGENLTRIAADNMRVFYRSHFSEGSFNGWLRSELYDNGPLLVAFQLREGFQTMGKDEIIEPETEFEKNDDGSPSWHTCLLVGWRIDGEGEYFEIQNSYGPWADDGFGFIIADDVEEAYMWDVVVKG